MITTMHSDQNASPPRVEVITSVQRRRRWPTAEKIRLVEETMQPGMSVSYVARRAGVAPSLLFNWRRRRRSPARWRRLCGSSFSKERRLGCGALMAMQRLIACRLRH